VSRQNVDKVRMSTRYLALGLDLGTLSLCLRLRPRLDLNLTREVSEMPQPVFRKFFHKYKDL
jgi:hypothetical protein